MEFGKMRIMRSSSLKQRIFGVIVFLAALPLACFGLTYYSMLQSDLVQKAMDNANSGASSLDRINGSVYAIVMESRGIYMSPDWKTAEPYAKQLLNHLAQLKASAESWKQTVIEAERTKVDALAVNLDQFIRFRVELVRLAREENTAAARVFGDNDTNRKTRGELNTQLAKLADAYRGHKLAAEALRDNTDRLNAILLIGIVVTSIVTGAIGTFLVHRTVIMLVNRMRIAMMDLAGGNLRSTFEGVDRKDEIGDFAPPSIASGMLPSQNRVWRKRLKSSASELNRNALLSRQSAATPKPRRPRRRSSKRRKPPNSLKYLKFLQQASRACRMAI